MGTRGMFAPRRTATVTIESYDFLTILLLVLLEGLLSADNAMVLAVLVLGLPKSRRKRALRYGIGGALRFAPSR